MVTELLDIRCCDCMELMRGFPDKHFDLAVVDPPYGIGADGFSNGQNLSRSDGWSRGPSTATKTRNRLNSGGGKLKGRLLNNSDCSWDVPPGPEYFAELFRVSRNQVIWGGNYFDLPPTRGIICWDKVQPWENFSQFELAWTSFDRPAAMFRKSNTGGNNKETKIHPTQKPVDLYRWVFAKYAEKGMRVVDTHLGSGSIAIAAHYAGISLTASEISPLYYDEACERIGRETRQMTLFEGF